MTERRRAIIERAIELDDDLPIDVCPGCGGRLSRWWGYALHSPGEPDQRATMHEGPGVTMYACPWTGDMLAARHLRRLIARGEL